VNAKRIRKIIDLRRCVNLKDRLFSNKNCDIGIVSCFLPVVVEIESIDEECGWLVMVSVPHCAGRNFNRVIRILVISRTDLDDVGICSFQPIV
jgi:hypothetical protein